MTRYMRSAAVAVAALFLVTTAASAAPILQVTGGILTGANGVDVGGTLYDVEFLDGSCVSVFSGCDDASDFAFHTDAEANTAGVALLAQVFVDGPLGNFDTNPALTRGCSSTGACIAWIPYAFSSSFFVTSRLTGNRLDESSDSVGIGAVFNTFDFAALSGDTWARWTPSATTVPVPEPTSLSLLGVGLVGVGARRWRHRRDARRL